MVAEHPGFTTMDNPNFPGVADIEPQELWDKRSEVAIIDVRRPDEFTGELGHIPDAQHIVLDTLPQRLEELPKDKTLVFVCLAGGRSARASAFVTQSGFPKVYNLRGGMQLWNQLGLEVEGRNQG